MVTTAPHPDPRPDQEDQPDQQETARAPKRGDWSTWRGASVAIIVLSTLALHPDAPGGLPGGRTVLYPRSYGQAFHTEGGWETWTQDDGSEHLQVGDLHILLRRPDPPPRVVEVPFEFDDQALGTWPVAHPQSLAGAHPQSLAGAHPQSLAGAHPQSLAGAHPQSLAGAHPQSLAGAHPQSLAGCASPVSCRCASPVSCRLRIPSLLPVRIPSLLPVRIPSLLPVRIPSLLPVRIPSLLPVAHPQSLAGCASPVSCRCASPVSCRCASPVSCRLRIPSLLPVRIPSLLPVSSPRQRRRAISDAGRTGSEEGGCWDSRTTDPGVIRGMPGPHNGSERAGPRPECRGSDSFRGTMIHGGRSSPDTAGTRGTGSAPP